MYDIAIIGAGVVGAMCSRALSRYKLKVCILEKESDVAMGATAANSGIVHAGFDAVEGTLKAKLNVLGAQMMPQIAKELGVEYKNNGSLVIGYDESDRAKLEMLYNRGVANGVKELRLLDRDELKALEPNISDDAKYALLAPTAGIICPYSLAISAIGNAMDNGVDLILDFAVESISFDENEYSIKSSDGKEVKSKYIINASGVHSDDVATMAGDDSFSVKPRKGEYILLDKECCGLVNHTIFTTPSDKGKGILVSPTAHGNVILGPTSVFIDDKGNKATASDGFDSIISSAKSMVNNIQFGKTITSFCGLRAVGDTGDFIINSNKPNFINVAGIESPGLSASPAIAEYVLDMLKSMGLKLEINEKYNPFREPYNKFSKLSLSEKNEMIKQNPDYGKIICRCETVTKGEIVDALRRNPKPTTLDGIKRRTRASMGRCQGGFCYPYLVEILSEELGIPYSEVTKFGGESIINIGTTKGEIEYEK